MLLTDDLELQAFIYKTIRHVLLTGKDKDGHLKSILPT